MQFLKRHMLTVVFVAIIFLVVLTGVMGAVIRYYSWFGTALSASRTIRHSSNAVRLQDGQDWAQYRFDLAGTGMNPEGNISAKNVTQLAKRWTINPRLGMGSSPAIVNGLVYITAGNSLL